MCLCASCSEGVNTHGWAGVRGMRVSTAAVTKHLCWLERKKDLGSRGKSCQTQARKAIILRNVAVALGLSKGSFLSFPQNIIKINVFHNAPHAGNISNFCMFQAFERHKKQQRRSHVLSHQKSLNQAALKSPGDFFSIFSLHERSSHSSHSLCYCPLRPKEGVSGLHRPRSSCLWMTHRTVLLYGGLLLSPTVLLLLSPAVSPRCTLSPSSVLAL